MPFCPKCRYEYEPHVSVCPDCEERLVSSLPPVSEAEDELPEEIRDWVELARLTSREYAQMLLGALRSRGIPIVIRSEAGYFGETGQMGMAAFSSAHRGFLVYVPEEHVVAADIQATAMLGDTWKKSLLVDIENAGEYDEGTEPEEDR